MTVAALCENITLNWWRSATVQLPAKLNVSISTQKQFPKVTAQKVIVSEVGASVYSASELAAQEFPDLDVPLRGAVSIARRLQDPLAELVKIDPKSIGVGQYQYDVSQTQLVRKLDAVVEDHRVNAVGVDLNTASVPMLTRVVGLTRRWRKTSWPGAMRTVVPEPSATAESEPSGGRKPRAVRGLLCAFTMVITC